MSTIRYSHLFDSSAINNLGKLPDSEWRDFHQSWSAGGHTTAWTPTALGELLGTNLAPRHGRVGEERIRQIQTAVRRFEVLSRREILPVEDTVIRDSIFALAGKAAPPSSDDFSADGRHVIDSFLALRDPLFVRHRRSEDAIEVEILADSRAEAGVSVTVPLGFRRFAQDEIARLRADSASHTEDTSGEQLARAVFDAGYPQWERVGRQLQIPADVLESASAKSEALFRSAFMYRMLAQGVYAIRRARRGAAEPTENDGRDLAFASYLGLALVFVTDDVGLRDLLMEVLEGRGRVQRLACAFWPWAIGGESQ